MTREEFIDTFEKSVRRFITSYIVSPRLSQIADDAVDIFVDGDLLTTVPPSEFYQYDIYAYTSACAARFAWYREVRGDDV